MTINQILKIIKLKIYQEKPEIHFECLAPEHQTWLKAW